MSVASNALTTLDTVKTELGLSGSGSVAARGTLTFTGLPSADETFVVNDTTFTAKASGAGTDEFNIGADEEATCDNIVAMFNAGSEADNCVAWQEGDTVIFEWKTPGTVGNSIVFTESLTNATVDGSDTLGGTTAGTSSTTDSYLERLINVVSDQIAAYCNRVFQWGESISEDMVGHGTNFLIVSRTPLDTINSITYDDDTIDSDNYEIHDADAGLIFNPAGWTWTTYTQSTPSGDPVSGYERKLYTIDYDAGYVTPQQEADDPTLTRNLPYDLEDACIQLVVSRYRWKGKDPKISSEKLMSWSVQYTGVNPGIGRYEFPAMVKATLDKYARVAMA